LTPIRIATIAGRSEEEASVAAALEVRRDVDLVMRCVDRVGLLTCVRARRVDAVVPVGAPQWLDRETAAEAIAAGVKLVGYGGDRLDVEMLQALGARHLSDNASLDDLVAACSEDEDVSLPVTRHVTGSGRIVAVWGPKGAPGRTRVAIEVAAEIAATTERTLLVDADPYGGDVLQLLGVIEELPTVVWAARAAARCDLATTVLPALRRAWDGGPVLLPGLPRGRTSPQAGGANCCVSCGPTSTAPSSTSGSASRRAPAPRWTAPDHGTAWRASHWRKPTMSSRCAAQTRSASRTSSRRSMG